MLKDGVINDLYHGRIAPLETRHKKSEKYKNEVKKSIQLLEDLKILLAKSDHEVLEKFLESNTYLSDYNEEKMFKEGFMLGAKLMNELLVVYPYRKISKST